MRRMPASSARKLFADIVNRAYYSKESTIVTRRGRDLAAVVPMSLLPPEIVLLPAKKKPAGASGQRKINPE